MKKYWEKLKVILKKIFPNWIHILIKVPIILVVLYVLTLGLLYVTSVPGFCQICHEMKPYYKRWKESTHANVGCIDCHVEPDILSQLHHKIIAMKELYYHITGKYEYPIVPKELVPVDESCERCHSVKREFNLTGDLKMPHEKHMEIIADEPLELVVSGEVTAEVHFEGQRCVYCHLNVVHAPKEQDRRPQMEFCMDNCHNGEKAPENCDLCHTKKNVPASHKRADWLEVHGSKTTEEDCKACHAWRPDYCKACHEEKPESHTATWRTFHGETAEEDREGCVACHKDSFCMKCHGILPK